MPFYPTDATVPDELRTAEFVLLPLRTDHVELDYDALMTSKEMLRRWSCSDWPTDGFTLQDNYMDLERHQQEHVWRKAFTFTVLDPDESECLGCVYINPLWQELALAGVYAGQECTAVVDFWVRQSRLTNDLDERLLAALLEWFGREWAFDYIIFSTAKRDDRQVALFVEQSLSPCYTPEAESRLAGWAFYGFA